MAWIRVESSVARNRKFQQAGPAPSWLWLCGLAYCQEGLTDGFIPIESIDYLGVKNARRLATHLVAAGLWDAVDGGWQVHDYLDHNRPSSEVRRLQQERREAGANGGKASAEARRQALAAPVAVASLKQTANPALTASTATDQIRAGGIRPHPIQARRRKDAAFEGARVYVPQRAHSDFLALRQGAEPELLAFYEAVDIEWSTGARATDEPGPDMFAFWKARYAEKWPPTSMKAGASRWEGWQPRAAK